MTAGAISTRALSGREAGAPGLAQALRRGEMFQNVYSVTLRRVRPWSVRSTLVPTGHCDCSALHLCHVEFDFFRDEPSFRPAY